MVLKLVMAALISVGQFYSFDWGVYVQVLLLLTALISHKVQPYILSNDNLLQQAVLLVLAAMLSIVNAGSEEQSKPLSTSGVIALAGVCLVGVGVVAFILIDNRLTKRRNLKADPTRDPAARLEKQVQPLVSNNPPISNTGHIRRRHERAPRAPRMVRRPNRSWEERPQLSQHEYREQLERDNVSLSASPVSST